MSDDWQDEPVATATQYQGFSGGASTDGSRSGEYRGGRGGRGGGRGGSGGGGDGSCRKCGEEGHLSFNCPSNGDGGNRSCYKCGEEGHMSRDCPTNNAVGGGSSSRACFKCGEEGHMSRECPSNDGSRSGGNGDRPSRGCFNCGEDGHQKKDCPNPSKAGGDELDSDGKPRPPLYEPQHVPDEQLFSEGVDAGINFDAYENIPVHVSGSGEIPPQMISFRDSGLRELLVKNIERAGYTKPTPIQRNCIPTIMAGRDIMGCAQTGSGKTAAFILPILHKLMESGASGCSMSSCAEPSAVIIAPTRELAVQIHNEGRKFALNSMLTVVVVYGGASSASQYRQLQRGCSVLVATPGRLMDFVRNGRISFSNLKFLVLDEADRMLDMGFIGDIDKIVNHPSMPAVGIRQTLMFSATFPEEIQMLSAKFLSPEYVFYVVGVVGAANTDVFQEVVNVPRSQKRETLVNKLKEILGNSAKNKILVFVETKRTADFLASYLSGQKLNSTSIHGDRYQSQREEALSQFKAGIRSILVATAVAARGLDIRGVSHVINYDLPKEVDEYVHRIGRTGRVGNKGYALSFYDQDNDGLIAKNLVKILTDAAQVVPDWLEQAAQSSGHSLTYDGTGCFASSDIRGGEGSVQAFGGPAVVDDDENWD